MKININNNTLLSHMCYRNMVSNIYSSEINSQVFTSELSSEILVKPPTIPEKTRALV